MSVVVMGGRDWFQALASAMGIPGVAGSATGHDSGQFAYALHCAQESASLSMVVVESA